MKQKILFFFLFIPYTVFSQQLEHVDAIKFKSLIESGEGIILDVRTPKEVANGHIAGTSAINIADPGFTKKAGLLPKEKPIYVYCLTGSRSAKAGQWMVQNGFKKVYNLQKGILDWNRNGYPVEKSEDAVANTATKYTNDDFNKILKSKKVVLVSFYAPWCAPCKKMEPDINKLIEKYKGKIEIIKAEIEANDELAKALKVLTVPTLLLFKKEKQVWRNDGAMSFDALDALLKKQ